ncbi:hypothetical protein ACFZB4_33305 [Streptomyces pseudovenezuelae]|uniref:hypothetical protein n=1 Tax=Streptomyces pseudovenezuelae TaxID=67350 RepID=UPI0036EEB0EB
MTSSVGMRSQGGLSSRFPIALYSRDRRSVAVARDDSGPGELRTPDTAPESEHGCVLLLVAAPADGWGVRERDPGKVVRCDFVIRSPAG